MNEAAITVLGFGEQVTYYANPEQWLYCTEERLPQAVLTALEIAVETLDSGPDVTTEDLTETCQASWAIDVTVDDTGTVAVSRLSVTKTFLDYMEVLWSSNKEFLQTALQSCLAYEQQSQFI